MSFLGTYRGIVIQNNDPDNMGRVKVFVPSISMTLYEGWNKEVDENIYFRSAGENINSKLTTEILKRLKECLPWAEVVQPILGPSGSGYYNSEQDYATMEGSFQIESKRYNGFRTGSSRMGAHNILKTLINNVMDPTRISYGAGPKNYNKPVGENSTIVNTLPALTSRQGNLPNGIISIPDVMNNVWVIFEGGNPLLPLVVGSILTREDHLSNSGITSDLD